MASYRRKQTFTNMESGLTVSLQFVSLTTDVVKHSYFTVVVQLLMLLNTDINDF